MSAAPDLRVGIVGGSLVGCAAATALRRAGCRVTVLERSEGELRSRGSGLALPGALVQTLIDQNFLDERFPVSRFRVRKWLVKEGDAPLGRTIWDQPYGATGQNWRVLYDNFRKRVPEEEYRRGAAVVAIEQRGRGVDVGLADGTRVAFDLLVGADGYSSTVRELLFPEAETHYAGYVAWRGEFWERESPIELSALPQTECVTTPTWPRGHGGFWWAPGFESAEPPHRQVTWILYDNLEREFFPGAEKNERGHFKSIFGGGLEPDQLGYVHRLAGEVLPPLLARVVEVSPAPSMSPIFDIRLPSLAKGRVVLLGDAATTVRPVTVSGLTKGLGDVLALAEALKASATVEEAVERYDAERAPEADRVIRMGIHMGDRLVSEAPEWAAMSTADMERWFDETMSGHDWYATRDAP